MTSSARKIHYAVPAMLVATLGLSACQSIGPTTVPRDRSNYSAAISESWNSQMLLNIVKLRYSDLPVFVDVGQIVAGYSLETSVSAGAQFSAGALVGDTQNLGAQGRYTDRPTITYVPLTGGKFMQQMLTPVSPAAVFRAIQAGTPADTMLWLGVASINGIRNVGGGANGVAPPDPKFLRIAELLRAAQASGALGIRVRPKSDGSGPMLVSIRNRAAPPEAQAGLEELRRLLRLPPGSDEFPLVLSDVPDQAGELAVQSRTLLGMLQALAAYVDIPAEDVKAGRAMGGISSESGEFGRLHFRVSSSESRPDDASVVVPYRGRHYYIDDRDLVSKRIFATIMLLFTLGDTGPDGNLPLLTIPTG